MADFSKTTVGFKPSYATVTYKPYRQGNVHANGPASNSHHSASYNP
jgi:hypothetical protein